MDLAGRGKPVTVEVEAAPAYELLMSLATFSNRAGELADTFEVGPSWFEHVRATSSPALLSALDSSGLHLGSLWCHLLGLACESAPAKDVPAFLARVEAAEPVDLQLHVLGYYAGYHGGGPHQHTPPDVIVQAVKGDAAARQRVIDDQADDHEHQEALRQLFALSPEETKRRLLDTLQYWDADVFRQLEPEVMPILERDAAAKRRLVGTVASERLIDMATNGLQYSPEPGIARVLLIPSYTFRPWVLISGHRDTRIFCYPVADESLAVDAESSSARLLRLYKALSDERRLRALQKLSTTSCTLQEMADYLGIGKSLMHHHLATLRAAGLVRIRLDEDKRYELRPDVIADMPGLLDTYLRGRGEEAGRPHRARRARKVGKRISR